MATLTAEELTQIGLEYLGFKVRRQRSDKVDIRRFRSGYGLCPESVIAVLNDVRTTDIDEARISKVNPKYALMALKWMKGCQSLEDLAGVFDVDEGTVSTWVWKYVRSFQALKAAKVSGFPRTCSTRLLLPSLLTRRRCSLDAGRLALGPWNYARRGAHLFGGRHPFPHQRAPEESKPQMVLA